MRARHAVDGGRSIADLKKAETWLKSTGSQIRAQRFAPVAESARSLWELLRTASSVELERVVLEGTGPMRRVTVDVTVDGIEGAALGVMSQGELHAMALSLFLPRATLPESPWARFGLLAFSLIVVPRSSAIASPFDPDH